jgi:WYL_2, Sm-like SH3 beta-barrel fold
MLSDIKEREWLRTALHDGVVEVTFTKKDGSERLLRCTLDPKIVPTYVSESTDEVKIERKKPENSISVYDVENSGWRAFQFDSVKHVQLTIE